MVGARQRFFGRALVDPLTGAVRRDRVVLSWFGCTSFALAIYGTVLLLDAWVLRGQHSGYAPTDPEEVAALAPRAILIGHGHDPLLPPPDPSSVVEHPPTPAQRPARRHHPGLHQPVNGMRDTLSEPQDHIRPRRLTSPV